MLFKYLKNFPFYAPNQSHFDILTVKMMKFQFGYYSTLHLFLEILRQQILHLECYTPVFPDTILKPYISGNHYTMYIILTIF